MQAEPADTYNSRSCLVNDWSCDLGRPCRTEAVAESTYPVARMHRQPLSMNAIYKFTCASAGSTQLLLAAHRCIDAIAPALAPV